MTHHFTTDSAISDRRAEELLSDIEDARPIGVQQVRAISTLLVKAGVEVRGGDVCARERLCASGNTTELQRSGVSCVLTRPVIAGSIFNLSFERSSLDLDSQLAVCDRVIMLGETAFETHFRFTHDIALPADDDRQ